MAQNRKNSKKNRKIPPTEANLMQGIELLHAYPLFNSLYGELSIQDKQYLGKDCPAQVTSSGYILLNKDLLLTPRQWIYVISHCRLHLAFGHFDQDKMPGYNAADEEGGSVRKTVFRPFLWNEACDIYIHHFLTDIKAGDALYHEQANALPANLKSEVDLYYYLLENNFSESEQYYGTAAPWQCDMLGLDHPLTYDSKSGEYNEYTRHFAYAMAESVSNAVSISGGHTPTAKENTASQNAARWFVDHYPLLGALASHFKVIENHHYCYQNDIQIAAINVDYREIYVNPACHYTTEQWRFVLAHEYLHAGLQHRERCQGRDHYLWNVACDFVINGWLAEMHIGEMPADGLLYDVTLKNLSAEEIYDHMLSDMRKYRKLNTFHGNGKGDILGNGSRAPSDLPGKKHRTATSLDDFCREALWQGLEYHLNNNRGYIPAGLLEEIRALAMPPIPWDVKLAKWFDLYFAPLEKHRSYARPSRRQASTPDIPRPRYAPADIPEHSRTFGVVVDTSGSMSIRQLGMALGSIASYATARDVLYARVVFCDADAYDAGYLSVEEIAGRVNVKGRGGTILQPAMDLLHRAKDFPADAPILIITDGMIEEHLSIKHEHAYLLPKGNRLPFRTHSPVFYFEEA